MALAPPAVTAAIIAAGPELLGADWYRLATVLGSATVAWAVVPANLVLSGVTTGVVGSGLVNGKLLVPPVPITVPAASTSVGLLGFVSPSMARAVGIGVATAFSAAGQYQGASVGVGTGSDISKVVVANPAALILSIQGVAASAGMVGGDMPRLATALGTGISTLLLTGTGVGVVTGPAGPLPAGGSSISRVF
jgi:hypothetical protein